MRDVNPDHVVGDLRPRQPDQPRPASRASAGAGSARTRASREASIQAISTSIAAAADRSAQATSWSTSDSTVRDASSSTVPAVVSRSPPRRRWSSCARWPAAPRWPPAPAVLGSPVRLCSEGCQCFLHLNRAPPGTALESPRFVVFALSSSPGSQSSGDDTAPVGPPLWNLSPKTGSPTEATPNVTEEARHA
jgi:hypothetical protein